MFQLAAFLVLTLAFSNWVNAATGAVQASSVSMENPGYEDKPAWFKHSFLDLREDVDEATDSDKRVMLYFYQDGCPYCARLIKDNFSSTKISTYVQTHFEVIAINMWGDRTVVSQNGKEMSEKQFAASMRVQFTPTILFLNEQADQITRINGYFPPDKFYQVLEYVAGKHEQQGKFTVYQASQAKEKRTGTIQNEAFFLSNPLALADNREQSWRPLVVIFEQPRCAACDEFHQDSLRRLSVVNAMSNLDVAQLNIKDSRIVHTPDGRKTPINQWSQDLGVQYTPTMVFFDRVGREVFRIEAYVKSFHLSNAIEYVTTGAYLHQPNFQRFLQHKTEILEAAGIEVKLMQ